MAKTRIAAGLSALTEHYDAFILDQWGVLHDGKTVPAAVPDCLERLRQAGKPVVILSNSGRRSAENERRLAELGIERGFYRACVTSGEVLWQALRHGDHPIFSRLGRSCLLFSRGGDRSVVDGVVGLTPVDSADQADFVLLSGCDTPETSVETYVEWLGAAARRRLPMICANPDLVGPTAAGPVPGAGTVARHYEAMGAPVYYVGKPFPAVFGAALAGLTNDGAPAVASSRVCVIGDSLTHDIAGGQGVGCATALVTSGLHAARYGGPLPVEPDADSLEALFRSVGVVPDWALPGLRW